MRGEIVRQIGHHLREKLVPLGKLVCILSTVQVRVFLFDLTFVLCLSFDCSLNLPFNRLIFCQGEKSC